MREMNASLDSDVAKGVLGSASRSERETDQPQSHRDTERKTKKSIFSVPL
jgi:hypothetical protein